MGAWLTRRTERIWLALAMTVALATACSAPKQTDGPPKRMDGAVAEVPDAVPRTEPRSAYGNPAFYEVNGARYFVLPASDGYVERGVASWYGRKFHGERTASGETYDMYAMTAAHKTLPLPSYARVTSLKNGKSIVVRINDRGPFVDDRLIDLSYAAAAKLDMIETGTTLVEVRVIGAEAALATSEAPQQARPPRKAVEERALFIQVGAFSDAANAERLAARLRRGGFDNVLIRHEPVNGRPIHRVRIGPIATVDEFDRVIERVRTLEIRDAHLALD